jgi:transposase
MLNLKNLVEVNRVESPGQYEVEATVIGTPPTCGCLFPNLVKNGRRRSMFFDTPIHGRKVGIWVLRQRYQCTGCKRTYYEKIPHMHPKHDMTERLVEYIQTFGTERTFTAIANEIGVDVVTVRYIWRTHAKAELDRLAPVTPQWLGIDELHIMHAYRGVITNVKERTIVDLLKDRKQETVIRYLAGLEDREVITHVAMDMYAPYREAVRVVLPNAKIVVDRFHIARMGSEAMERVRKELRAGLTSKERLQMKDDRWLLLRNAKDLDAGQTILLQSVLGQFPLLNKAWTAKEAFRAIWNNRTRQEGEAAYQQWLKDLDPEIEPAFRDLNGAMNNWGTEIFNYFEHRITNAYTESFNSIARKMDRMGRGYSFEVLRAKLLLKHSCHKKEMAPPRFNRTASFSMGRMTGFMVMEETGRHLGVDISTLADWLDTLPEKG